MTRRWKMHQGNLLVCLNSTLLRSSSHSHGPQNTLNGKETQLIFDQAPFANLILLTPSLQTRAHLMLCNFCETLFFQASYIPLNRSAHPKNI